METNKQIAIGGTNHLKSADNGSLAHMINVRPERGVLRPITAKLPLQINNIDVPASVNSYDRHFLHKNAEFAHWIGVSAAGSVEWYNATTGAVIAVIGVVPGITKILSLKNFLILITPIGIVKYLYITSGYKAIDIWEANYAGVSLAQKLIPTNLPTVLQSHVDFPVMDYSDTQLVHPGQLAVCTTEWTGGEPIDVSTSTAALIDAIYQVENKLSKDGKMIGMFWYRWAYRLYDGSHIFPSAPQLTDDFNMMPLPITGVQAMHYQVNVGHSPGNEARAWVAYSELVLNYTPSVFAAGLNDIIVGIDLFASKPVRPIKLDSDSITPAMLELLTLDAIVSVNSFAPVNPEVEVIDVDNWYLIQKFTTAELVTGTTMDIKLEGFWTNWANREVLGAESGTWHNVMGKTGMIYNNRLMLGDIATQLLKCYPLKAIDKTAYNDDHQDIPPGDIVWRFDDATVRVLNVKIITTLKTDDGEMLVCNDERMTIKMIERYIKTNAGYTYAPNNVDKVILPGLIWYPDYRAREIKIVVQDIDETWKLLDTITLKSATNNNFAYYNFKDYTVAAEYIYGNADRHRWREVTVNLVDGLMSLPIYSVPTNINQTISDQNRVIASGLNNPLTWAADNSYRVGNGRVVALGANTEPLSQGQFGEHPVLVFSSEGIFGLMQGNFPVLFQSVSPLAGDICLSDNLLPLRNSIIFLGERGVTAISGKQTTVLSEILNGTAFNPISQLNIYDQMVTDARLSNSHGLIMAETDIRDYLDATTCLAYDHKRDELIVFTPGKLYSWFFSFLNQQWYKCSQNWKSSINAWPDSYVQHNSGQILDLTLESDTATAEIFIQTNPVRMGGYVGIDDLSLYGDITPGTGKYTGIYLFGSEMEDNYFAMGGTQTEQRLRTYKSNSFSRIKVSNLLLILSSIADNQTFITPVFNLTFKPKFNQIKS